MGIQDRQILRWILLGIPAGLFLAVAGVALMVWKGERPADPWRHLAPASGGTPAEVKLRDYVTTLSERVGERSAAQPEGLRAAQLFLESTFGPNNTGYVTRRQEFEAGGRTFANLEAVLPGKEWARETVVVGAHYDTAEGSPGADDNGSGVATLLLLAERFVGKPQKRTLRWVAFSNEEPPWFHTPGMGSVRYAAELKREGVEVVAMIALESLGYFRDEPGSQKYPEPLAKLYPDTANFLAVVGNLPNRRFVDYAHERLRETGLIPVEKGAFPEMVPGVGWSDHWAFWQEGYPAVMLTDTAPYRNPHYHRDTDRADTLDYRRMAAAAKAIEALVARLANDPRESW